MKKDNRGGKREGAGRKSKADEDRIRGLCLKSMTKVFGGEEEAFEHIAKQSKDSFPHLKLLFEYAYGKPKEKVEFTDMTPPKPKRKHFLDFGNS